MPRRANPGVTWDTEQAVERGSTRAKPTPRASWSKEGETISSNITLLAAKDLGGVQ